MEMNDIEIRKRTLQLVEPQINSKTRVCGGVLLKHSNRPVSFLTVSWSTILHIEALCDTGMETVGNTQMGTIDTKWAVMIPATNGHYQEPLSPHFIRWDQKKVINQTLGETPFPTLQCVPSSPRFLREYPNNETFSVATVSPIFSTTNNDVAKIIGTHCCLCNNLRVSSIPTDSHLMEFKIDTTKIEPTGSMDNMQVSGCPILDRNGSTVALAYYAKWGEGKVLALNLERYRLHMENQPFWR
ncbi:MAG: hypothetical protein ILM98_16105 [Kiritimatiellae bacterium]|nr:hypothetical protein [Kiritimatiellia bacterium]